MKLCHTFALAGLAANFNSVFGIDNTDLVDENGIIWNSDKTLCLKQYGKIFESQKNDYSGYLEKDRQKWEARDADFHTCEKVFLGFSTECVGVDPADLSHEFRFKISDHTDYFCIIPGLPDNHLHNDGEHPCSSDQDGNPWKVTALDRKSLKQKSGWKRNYYKKEVEIQGAQKEYFSLRLYGCNECDTLEKYFKFEEGTNKLIYGKFKEDEGNQEATQIFWNQDKNYLWDHKSLFDDQNNFLANAVEEPSCDASADDSADDSDDEQQEATVVKVFDSFESLNSEVVNPGDYPNFKFLEFEYSTNSGEVFIFTGPSDFIAAFKIPTNKCFADDDNPKNNFEITISEFQGVYSANLDSYNNCYGDEEISLGPLEDAFNENFNSFTLYGPDVTDEVENGGGDLLVSDSVPVSDDPATYNHKVHLKVTNMVGFLEMYVLDHVGKPMYLASLQLS